MHKGSVEVWALGGRGLRWFSVVVVVVVVVVVYRFWSYEEDQQLAELVDRFGAKNWALSEWVGQ